MATEMTAIYIRKIAQVKGRSERIVSIKRTINDQWHNEANFLERICKESVRAFKTFRLPSFHSTELEWLTQRMPCWRLALTDNILVIAPLRDFGVVT
jgi:hypothetical protein